MDPYKLVMKLVMLPVFVLYFQCRYEWYNVVRYLVYRGWYKQRNMCKASRLPSNIAVKVNALQAVGKQSCMQALQCYMLTLAVMQTSVSLKLMLNVPIKLAFKFLKHILNYLNLDEHGEID